MITERMSPTAHAQGMTLSRDVTQKSLGGVFNIEGGDFHIFVVFNKGGFRITVDKPPRPIKFPGSMSRPADVARGDAFLKKLNVPWTLNQIKASA